VRCELPEIARERVRVGYSRFSEGTEMCTAVTSQVTVLYEMVLDIAAHRTRIIKIWQRDIVAVFFVIY
jgi:hypothetical protein